MGTRFSLLAASLALAACQPEALQALVESQARIAGESAGDAVGEQGSAARRPTVQRPAGSSATQPVADGSSIEALDESLDHMRSGMTPQQISDFTDALMRIQQPEARRLGASIAKDPGALDRHLCRVLDGLTAAQILALGAEGK
jgi:hypothetical protein